MGSFFQKFWATIKTNFNLWLNRGAIKPGQLTPPLLQRNASLRLDEADRPDQEEGSGGLDTAGTTDSDSPPEKHAEDLAVRSCFDPRHPVNTVASYVAAGAQGMFLLVYPLEDALEAFGASVAVGCEAPQDGMIPGWVPIAAAATGFVVGVAGNALMHGFGRTYDLASQTMLPKSCFGAFFSSLPLDPKKAGRTVMAPLVAAVFVMRAVNMIEVCHTVLGRADVNQQIYGIVKLALGLLVTVAAIANHCMIYSRLQKGESARNNFSGAMIVILEFLVRLASMSVVLNAGNLLLEEEKNYTEYNPQAVAAGLGVSITAEAMFILPMCLPAMHRYYPDGTFAKGLILLGSLLLMIDYIASRVYCADPAAQESGDLSPVANALVISFVALSVVATGAQQVLSIVPACQREGRCLGSADNTARVGPAQPSVVTYGTVPGGVEQQAASPEGTTEAGDQVFIQGGK
jgi:hypothetical protein